MAITATLGVTASLSDTATGLQVTGVGSAVLNVSKSLGIQDATIPAGTVDMVLPLPLGATTAQFYFVSAVGIPDLQLVESGAMAGTSTSGAAPATTVLATDTLILDIDGDGPRTITFAAGGSGAVIAADIQAKVRALVALNPIKQIGYLGFTAVFSGGLYVLTSGTFGGGSSVVVTGGTAAASLKLGTGNGGVEVAGSGPTSRQIPLGAATVLYNVTSGSVRISTNVGGLLQFAVGGA